jgi:hypothetical protein
MYKNPFEEQMWEKYHKEQGNETDIWGNVTSTQRERNNNHWINDTIPG